MTSCKETSVTCEGGNCECIGNGCQYLSDGGIIQNTDKPTPAPLESPTKIRRHPTIYPTSSPSINPTYNPSNIPTNIPTTLPTKIPLYIPSMNPSLLTNVPSYVPTKDPTIQPTMEPTIEPTLSDLTLLSNDKISIHKYLFITVGAILFILILCMVIFLIRSIKTKMDKIKSVKIERDVMNSMNSDIDKDQITPFGSYKANAMKDISYYIDKIDLKSQLTNECNEGINSLNIVTQNPDRM